MRGPVLEIHASGAVDEQIHRQVLVLLEHAREQATQAAVDVPVDPPQIVAGHIRPEVRELETGAAVAGNLVRVPSTT